MLQQLPFYCILLLCTLSKKAKKGLFFKKEKISFHSLDKIEADILALKFVLARFKKKL